MSLKSLVLGVLFFLTINEVFGQSIGASPSYNPISRNEEVTYLSPPTNARVIWYIQPRGIAVGRGTGPEYKVTWNVPANVSRAEVHADYFSFDGQLRHVSRIVNFCDAPGAFTCQDCPAVVCDGARQLFNLTPGANTTGFSWGPLPAGVTMESNNSPLNSNVNLTFSEPGSKTITVVPYNGGCSGTPQEINIGVSDNNKRNNLEYTYSELDEIVEPGAMYLLGCDQSKSCSPNQRKLHIYAKMHIADSYTWGKKEFSASGNFLLRVYVGTTSLLTRNISLSIDQNKVEQLFYEELPGNFNGPFDKIEIVPQNHSASGLIDPEQVKFSFSYKEENYVNSIPVLLMAPTNMGTLSGTWEHEFRWGLESSPGCSSALRYEFQLMRLYDESQTTGEPNDWGQALKLNLDPGVQMLKVSIAEGTGLYAWRVRSIGTDEGVWTSANRFYFQNPDDQNNWIYSRTFTEGNKISEQLTFANGLQQVQQQQTRVSGRVVATQTLQDYVGRNVISTLPVPLKGADNKLGYKENLINSGYDKSVYDNDPRSAPAMTFSSPYYSAAAVENVNNISVTINEGVASAQGFPYTRTVFTNDGTGRVKEQSGVGIDHKIGSGRTVRTYYSATSESEMLMLFGEQAPEPANVNKITTFDANGTASITYQNKDGKVLATALSAGSGGGSLVPLENNAVTIYENIEGSTQLGSFLQSTKKPLFFTMPRQLNVSYSITPAMLSEVCEEECRTCDYKIEIILHDLDAQVGEPKKITLLEKPIQMSKACGSSQAITLATTTPRLLKAENNYILEKRVITNNLMPTGGLTYLENYIKEEVSSYETGLNESLLSIQQYLDGDDIEGLIEHISSNYAPNENGLYEIPVLCNDSIFINLPEQCDEEPQAVGSACTFNGMSFAQYFIKYWGERPYNTEGDTYAFTDLFINVGSTDPGSMEKTKTTVFPAAFDQMMANFYNQHIDVLSCADIWDIWTGHVANYGPAREAYANLEVEEEPDFIYEYVMMEDFFKALEASLQQNLSEEEAICNDEVKTYFTRDSNSLYGYINGTSRAFNMNKAYAMVYYHEGDDTQPDTQGMRSYFNSLLGKDESYKPTMTDYASLTQCQRYKLKAGGQSIQTGAGDPTEYQQKAQDQCGEVCESKREAFKQAVINNIVTNNPAMKIQYYDISAVEYMDADGILTTKYVGINDSTINVDIYDYSACEIENMAEALVQNCKDKYCRLGIVYDLGNETVGLGTQSQLDEMKKIFTHEFEVEVNSGGQTCGSDWNSLPYVIDEGNWLNAVPIISNSQFQEIRQVLKDSDGNYYFEVVTPAYMTSSIALGNGVELSDDIHNYMTHTFIKSSPDGEILWHKFFQLRSAGTSRSAGENERATIEDPDGKLMFRLDQSSGYLMFTISNGNIGENSELIIDGIKKLTIPNDGSYALGVLTPQGELGWIKNTNPGLYAMPAIKDDFVYSLSEDTNNYKKIIRHRLDNGELDSSFQSALIRDHTSFSGSSLHILGDNFYVFIGGINYYNHYKLEIDGNTYFVEPSNITNLIYYPTIVKLGADGSYLDHFISTCKTDVSRDDPHVYVRSQCISLGDKMAISVQALANVEYYMPNHTTHIDAGNEFLFSVNSELEGENFLTIPTSKHIVNLDNSRYIYRMHEKYTDGYLDIKSIDISRGEVIDYRIPGKRNIVAKGISRHGSVWKIVFDAWRTVELPGYGYSAGKYDNAIIFGSYEEPKFTCSRPSLCFKWTNPRSFDIPIDDAYDPQAQTCESIKSEAVSVQVQAERQRLINDRQMQIQKQYTNQCVKNLNDKFSIDYKVGTHHYTLYYYDRAGNLIQTVPPQGVKPLYVGTPAAIASARTTEPQHEMITSYQYNSLGQMVWQNTPDAGETQFIYNDIGQLRFSQNSQQKADGNYSYTKYDRLGRIVEVGQAAEANLQVLRNNRNDLDYPASGEQITRTIYTDNAPASILTGLTQRYLQNRVSYTYLDDDGSPVTLDDRTFTIYSYDPHGNVEWLVQNVPGLGEKLIKYEYDLLSGNVLQVSYNPGNDDEFYHKYEYDADNRITGVFTSGDGHLWDKDASYEYYAHGPLKRAIIGEDSVQNLDYVYTIHGWLKAINNPASMEATDAKAAADAFAMSLNYYNGDYQGVNTTITGVLPLEDSRDLYNGNISAWEASNRASDNFWMRTGMQYTYDELNRIRVGNFNVFRGNQFYTRGGFHSDYTYDANGNLKTLNRYDIDAENMDALVYHQHKNAQNQVINRLSHVQDFSNIAPDKHKNDIEYQNEFNYTYDNIGNLTSDAQADMAIDWTVYGKVRATRKGDGTLGTAFKYDAAGNRVVKKTVDENGNIVTDFYVRDASGNIMAIYKTTETDGNAKTELQEVPIYGSDRLGVYKPAGSFANNNAITSELSEDKHVNAYEDVSYNLEENVKLTLQPGFVFEDGKDGNGFFVGTASAEDAAAMENIYTRTLDKKQYELKDHLGNVRTVITDRKLSTVDGTTPTDFRPSIASASNYYPFGMDLPTVKWDTTEYLATMEADFVLDEVGEFENYIETRTNNIVLNHTDDEGAGTYSHTSMISNGKVGLAKSLKVQAGDKINAEVYGKYVGGEETVDPLQVMGMLTASFAQAFNLPASYEGSVTTDLLSGVLPGAEGLNKSGEEGEIYAYLNYILFDKNFEIYNAGFKRLSGAAEMAHERLSFDDVNPAEKGIVATEDGYIYIYLSNESVTSNVTEVHFDDFKITHEHLVADEGYNSGLIAYRYGFNGKEKDQNSEWTNEQIATSRPVNVTAYYPLDGDAEDKAPNSFKGYVEGDVTATADRNGNEGKALLFDGVDDKVTVNHNELLYSEDLTVSAWVKAPAQNTAGGVIVGKHEGGNTNQRSWLMSTSSVGPNDRLQIVVSESADNSKLKLYYSSIGILDNTWHHVAFTFADNELKLYIDGVEDPGVTKFKDAVVNSPNNNTANLTIGWRIQDDAESNFFKGAIDEVGIFDRTFSAADIAALADDTNPLEISREEMMVAGRGLNNYDYGFRIYNPAIARFLSVDPLTKSFPMLTPYQYASNTPIQAIDLDGLEAVNAMTGNVIDMGSMQSLNNLQSSNVSLWQDLFDWELSDKYEKELSKVADWSFNDGQRMEDASGSEVNTDYYAVTIGKMPKNMDENDLFDYVRKEFATIMDGNNVADLYVRDKEKWNSSDPTGSIVVFKAGFKDHSAVFTSKFESNNWIFTPLSTTWDWEHPLAGHRQFGLTKNEDGTFTFYTRGVDRMFDWEHAFVNWAGNEEGDWFFKQADELWNYVMDRVAAEVNKKGGEAKKTHNFNRRVNWKKDAKEGKGGG